MFAMLLGSTNSPFLVVKGESIVNTSLVIGGAMLAHHQRTGIFVGQLFGGSNCLKKKCCQWLTTSEAAAKLGRA